MSRLALVLVLLTASSSAAADLPPGALVRLGDDRFRAGGAIEHLALSPDGKQLATAAHVSNGVLVLSVWDTTRGRPINEYRVNRQLFKGFVWGNGGAFAVVTRTEPGTKNKRATALPDDFRVWDFTKAAPPLLPQDTVGLGKPARWVDADWPQNGPEYTEFRFSADGTHVAAVWKSAGDKYAIHVFETKQADTAAKLKRVGTLDLGAEGVDEVHLSADGNSVVTFRKLVNDGEMTATTWNVTTGRPGKPVRVGGARLIVTPDNRSLVVFANNLREWGFDQYDLATGEKRQLARRKYDPDRSDPPFDVGGFSFAPSGRELVVACGWKTYVIDLSGGEERGCLEGHAVVPDDRDPIVTAVSADGTRIATAGTAGLIRVWDAKTLRALDEAPGHRAQVEHAQLSPDGKRLLTWAADRTVRLWDVATGTELRAFTGTRTRDEPTLTPDGTTVLFSTERRLIARDLQTGLEVPLPGRIKDLGPRTAVFSPDGKTVLTWATADEDFTNRTCEVWEWPSGKQQFAWRPDGTGDEFWPGFSPDGSVLFEHPTSPKRYDAKTGKVLPSAWKEEFADQIESLRSLRPNPQWLISNEKDAPVVIEAGTGKPVPGFRLTYTSYGDRRVTGVNLALSSARAQFAVVALPLGQSALVCETATGEVRRRLTGHRGATRVLGFTPDGTKLLTAGGDHTVLVWDMRLQSVPLPDAVKNETSAAKLWDTLATGKADAAYLAMARLAREPDAAFKMAKMRLKPAAKGAPESDAANLADARAVELLEALDTDESRALLKELAGGHADAFRTQEAKRARERHR